jgi:hypothetical protein
MAHSSLLNFIIRSDAIISCLQESEAAATPLNRPEQSPPMLQSPDNQELNAPLGPRHTRATARPHNIDNLKALSQFHWTRSQVPSTFITILQPDLFAHPPPFLQSPKHPLVFVRYAYSMTHLVVFSAPTAARPSALHRPRALLC